jgi:CHAT domain-containing protein
MKPEDRRKSHYFAGHAVFLNPSLAHTQISWSHLVLNDYNLTAHEISQKVLRQGMVAVLSACETGMSKNIQSGELIGMVRGFYLAGATTVVAANWKVWTKSTRQLMEAFYLEILRGISIGEALRKERKSIYDNENYNMDILDWAAYTVYGDIFRKIREN